LLKPYAAGHSAPVEAIESVADLTGTLADHPPFETIRPVVIQLLYFVAMYSVFDAFAVIFGNAIRGAGIRGFR